MSAKILTRDDAVETMVMAAEVVPHYDRFLEGFSAERHARHAAYVRETTGADYTFATTPFFLPRARLERIIEATNSVVALLMRPEYHARIASTPWFLPYSPMQRSDFIGCVDYHVGDEEDGMIEVNFCPPGHVGFTQLIEDAFLAHHESPGHQRRNGAFEQELIDAVTNGGRFRRIAIGVNHAGLSVNYYGHYKYLERVFARHGIEAKVLYANQVSLDDEGFPVWDGVRYERIFNLLIPRVWQYHPDDFAQYTRVYEAHPEVFHPNPFGWRLGTKAFLQVCANVRNERFGLGDEDVERIRRVSLETWRLSDFATVEEALAVGADGDWVLKPLDNYHAMDVTIFPEPEKLAETWKTARDQYVLQRYHCAPVTPYMEPNGIVRMSGVSLRMTFLNGRFCAVRAYSILPEDMMLTPVITI